MRIVALLLPLLLAASAGGSTITLDFEEEAPGLYEPGFVSIECACVRLSEDPGDFGVLEIDDFFGSQVVIVGEEGGALLVEFLVPVTAVSLDFGNDSDSEHVGPATASLIGFSGGVEVARDEALANRNRLVDQTLTIAPGVVIDSALFIFPQSGEFEPISPIVDNLVLTTVPEPGLLGLGAAALVAIAAARASRSRPR